MRKVLSLKYQKKNKYLKDKSHLFVLKQISVYYYNIILSIFRTYKKL